MRPSDHPIFYDPSGRRWKRSLGLAGGVALVVSILGALFSFSIVALPLTPLPTNYSNYVRNLIPKVETRAQARRKFLADRTRERLMKQVAADRKARKKKRPHNTGKPYSTVVGFYVDWDPASYESLRKHIDALSYVMPGWLGLDDSGTKIVSRFNPTSHSSDPQAVQQSETQASVVSLAHRHNVPIVPMLDNAEKGTFHWDRLRRLLTQPGVQRRLALDVRKWLLSQHFAGINVDLEPDYSRLTQAQKLEEARILHEKLPAFVEVLKKTLAPAHLLVTEDLPPDDPAFDYTRLGKVNDFVIVMLYDNTTMYGDAGPIASEQWIEDMADRLFAKIDSSKVVLGLGNYCYDWPVELDSNGDIVKTYTSGSAAPSIGEALGIARDAQATIEMDGPDMNPHFSYVDEANRDHVVYMLDAITAYNTITALKGYYPRGAALWRLGSEDPTIWSFFNDDRMGKPIKPSVLETMVYRGEFSIEDKGRGELMEVASRPTPGKRKLTFDSDGLIDSEVYESYPSPYVVRRYGRLKNALALTFDDGPDPNNTPQILDILKENHVPGTFFMVGQMAERYPWLVKQCWADGDQIGNHTFTHPHIAEVSKLRADLEVNATQRVIESITGHSTRLFRPPFGEGADTEASSAEDVALLAETQQLGYVTVGMNIDPGDYTRPGSDIIVQRVLDEVKAGNVILLHDGGGDRSETIEALPIIIKDLKAKGYRFVGVSDLLHESRNSDLFPAVTDSQGAIVGVDRLVFESSFLFGRTLEIFFIVSIVLALFRILLIAPLAIRQARRQRTQHFPPYNEPVAVIIPAYNEGLVVCRTIKTALDSDYPNLRVIVVDDGSTDNTAEVVRSAYGHDPRVKLIRKENGGKASALNAGIAEAGTEVIVSIDADTVVSPDAVRLLVRHFSDPKVGAVAGNIKVGNRTNPLTIWQSLEYITSQNFERRAFGALDSVPVIPGALGAWRTSAVLDVGGYETNTLAEDTDLTFKIRLHGYHTRTENGALAFTEAPDGVRSLAKQRFRWSFGVLQSLWKHQRQMLKPQYGAFGLLVMPMMWVYSILFQVFAPLVDIMVILGLFNHEFLPVLLYYAALFVLDFISSLIAVRLDEEDAGQLVWLFWQRLFYRQFMYYVFIKSLLAALHGGLVGWGKLQRKATASLPSVAAGNPPGTPHP